VARREPPDDVTSRVFATNDAKRAAGLLAFYSGTGLQLFGEELLTILPFLAIMTLCAKTLGLSRKASIFWAWSLSAIVFGLLHLPT
jgi:uncharacterized protein